MNTADVVNLVQSITFKDWKFQAHINKFSDELTIGLVVPSEDSDNRGMFANFKMHMTLSLDLVNDMEERFLVEFIWHEVQNALLHEAGEWFYVGKTRPFHPHK